MGLYVLVSANNWWALCSAPYPLLPSHPLSAVRTTMYWSSVNTLMALDSSWLIIGLSRGQFFLNAGLVSALKNLTHASYMAAT